MIAMRARASLRWAGALHSQSPVDAKRGGDAATMLSLVAALLVNIAHFPKLNDSGEPASESRPVVVPGGRSTGRCSQDAGAIALGVLELAVDAELNAADRQQIDPGFGPAGF